MAIKFIVKPMYRCFKCKQFFERERPGPTECPWCGHIYVEWINSEDVLTQYRDKEGKAIWGEDRLPPLPKEGVMNGGKGQRNTERRRNTMSKKIMQMDERELYGEVYRFLHPKHKQPWLPFGVNETDLGEMLRLCYQGEEKLKGIGLHKEYIRYMSQVAINKFIITGTRWSPKFMANEDDMFKIAHASPKDRAKAILLTIEEGK